MEYLILSLQAKMKHTASLFNNSNKQKKNNHYCYTKAEGFGPRQCSYETTFAETSASPTYQNVVRCHQILVLAVYDQPFPVEIIQGSKFKGLSCFQWS